MEELKIKLVKYGKYVLYVSLSIVAAVLFIGAARSYLSESLVPTVEVVTVVTKEVQVTKEIVVEKKVVVTSASESAPGGATVIPVLPSPTNTPVPTPTPLPTATPMPPTPTPVSESEIPSCPFAGKLMDGRTFTCFGWYWDNGVRRYNLVIEGEGESNGVSEHWLMEHLVWWKAIPTPTPLPTSTPAPTDTPMPTSTPTPALPLWPTPQPDHQSSGEYWWYTPPGKLRAGSLETTVSKENLTEWFRSSPSAPTKLYLLLKTEWVRDLETLVVVGASGVIGQIVWSGEKIWRVNKEGQRISPVHRMTRDGEFVILDEDQF